MNVEDLDLWILANHRIGTLCFRLELCSNCDLFECPSRDTTRGAPLDGAAAAPAPAASTAAASFVSRLELNKSFTKIDSCNLPIEGDPSASSKSPRRASSRVAH